MSDWRRTTLGEVTTQVSRTVRVEDLTEARYAGVRWYVGGVYARETVPAKEIKGKLLYRIKSDDIVYNRMWATKASFGLVKNDADGCFVTNDFPVFTANPDAVLPEYVEAVFHTGSFKSEAAGRAVGTTERRRLHVRDFANIPVMLPPLPVQKRIIGVISSVDDQINALETEADALAGVMAVMRSQLLQPGDDWDNVTVGDLAETRTGRAFPDKYQGNHSGEVPYFKVADMNSPTNGRYLTAANNWLDTEGIMAVKPRICPPGTVVFPIIGAALLTEKRRLLVQPSAFDQNLMGLVPNGRVVSEYLLVVMSSIRLSELTQQGAVPSVNQKIVSAIRIPLAPRGVQERIVETLESIRSTVDAKHAESGRLRTVRAGLLSGLLDRTIETTGPDHRG